MNSSQTLLSLHNLTVSVGTRALVKAISFDLFPEETLCIVGESGSGKSMTLRSIVHVFPSQAIRIASGSIFLKGHDVRSMSSEQRRELVLSSIGFVPQAPQSSMNPMLSIGHQLMETMRNQERSREKIRKRAVYLLQKVGFSHPEMLMSLRPHQLSGGMKQRVLIASSLMNTPSILLLDEPTTALDVTLQAEILDLLLFLRKEFAFSMILVTHDLGVVARIADRVLVMEKGSLVESGLVEKVLLSPSHPYTDALVHSLQRSSLICGLS